MTRTEGGHSTDRDYFKLQFHAHNLELGFISTTMVCKHKCPRNSLYLYLEQRQMRILFQTPTPSLEKEVFIAFSVLACLR